MATDYVGVNASQIAATATTHYTNPAATKSFVNAMSIHNVNTTTESVKIYFVPNNAGAVGTAGLANRYWAGDLIANETQIIPLPKEGIILAGTNDTVQLESTTANKVNLFMSARRDT